jgi:hypothetical protein
MPLPVASTIDFKSSQIELDDTFAAVWSNATEKPAIMLAGVLANVSDDVNQIHHVTAGISAVDDPPGTGNLLFKNIPLVWGSSFIVPKTVLQPGQAFWAKVEDSGSAGLVTATASVMNT